MKALILSLVVIMSGLRTQTIGVKTAIITTSSNWDIRRFTLEPEQVHCSFMFTVSPLSIQCYTAGIDTYSWLNITADTLRRYPVKCQ